MQDIILMRIASLGACQYLKHLGDVRMEGDGNSCHKKDAGEDAKDDGVDMGEGSAHQFMR